MADFPALDELHESRGKSEQTFLRQSRLSLIYGLIASRVVEHVHELMLALKPSGILAVRFRGVLERIYSNVASDVINVDGERQLAN